MQSISFHIVTFCRSVWSFFGSSKRPEKYVSIFSWLRISIPAYFGSFRLLIFNDVVLFSSDKLSDIFELVYHPADEHGQCE